MPIPTVLMTGANIDNKYKRIVMYLEISIPLDSDRLRIKFTRTKLIFWLTLRVTLGITVWKLQLIDQPRFKYHILVFQERQVLHLWITSLPIALLHPWNMDNTSVKNWSFYPTPIRLIMIKEKLLTLLIIKAILDYRKM